MSSVSQYITQIQAQYQEENALLQDIENAVNGSIAPTQAEIVQDETQFGGASSATSTDLQIICADDEIIDGIAKGNVGEAEASLAHEKRQAIRDMHTDSPWVCNDVRVAYSNIGRLVQSMVAPTAQIKGDEEQLSAMDPAFSRLASALNAIIGISSVDGQENSEQSILFIANNLQKTKALLQEIYTAFQDEITAGQAGVTNNSTDLSTDEADAIDEMQQTNAAQGELNSAINGLATDATNAYTQYLSAYQDEKDTSMFSLDSHVGQDLVAKWENTVSQKAFTNSIGDLASSIASGEIEVAFSSINTAVESLFKKVEKILEDPSAVSSGKDLGKILNLMMLVLGYFNVIQEEVEKLKTENEQQMSKANLKATEMNLGASQVMAAIAQVVQAEAHVLKIVTLVTTVVLGVVFTAMAPGIGTAILMAGMSSYEAYESQTGDQQTKALTQDIGSGFQDLGVSSQLSQILSSVTIALAEVVVVVAGGAGIDLVVEKASQAAIREAVQEAEEIASNAANQVEGQAAKEEVRSAVIFAARSGAEMAAKQFNKQALYKIVFGGSLKVATKQAAKEAAELAAKDLIQLSDFSNPAVIDKVAQDSAYKAVSNSTKKSVQQIEKEASRSAKAVAGKRALFTGIGGLANSNFLLNIANAIESADGKKLSKSEMEIVTITLQVVQEIIQMIAMMMGGGFGEQADLKQGSSSLLMAQKGMVGMQSVSMLSSSVSSLGVGEVDETQAVVVKEQQIIGALSSALHSFLKEVQQDSNKERALFMQKLMAEVKSQESLSSNLYDGNTTGIEILVSGAV